MLTMSLLSSRTQTPRKEHCRHGRDVTWVGTRTTALSTRRGKRLESHAFQFAIELREEEQKTIWLLHSQQEENARCPGHKV